MKRICKVYRSSYMSFLPSPLVLKELGLFAESHLGVNKVLYVNCFCLISMYFVFSLGPIAPNGLVLHFL